MTRARWIPIIGATGGALWLVPDWPFGHLDEPVYWGVLGYVALLALLGWREVTGRRRLPRRLLAYTIVAMPAVYVASCLRHGGSPGFLVLEIVGLVVFGAAAYLGSARARWWIVLGLAAHAWWDIGHSGGMPYVPSWYALACAIADVGLAGYAASLLSGVGKSTLESS